MSIGVLVVEGAQYSGSAITARLAMDQQREVFAVPGNITSKMSWGPNLLIKQGAKLVQEWNDVVVELSPEDRRRLIVNGQPELPAEVSEDIELDTPLNKISREIVSKLKVDEPVHLDMLLETLEHCSSSEVIAALFDLELLGKVRQLPGRNFVKVSW
jgi:DNA processing protein